MRRRLASGLDALRATLTRFAADSSADAGIDVPAAANEQLANALLGLSSVLGILELADLGSVPVPLAVG